MENKLNGFNNGRDTTDGVGGRDVNYMHVVEDSQFYTNLDMIRMNLTYALERINTPEKGFVKGRNEVYITSFEEDIRDVVVGIENTIKHGYELQLK